MRTTSVLFRVHLGMQFKAHWLIQRKRKILQTPAESVLLSKGIQVIEAKDVLRPAINEEPYEPPSIISSGPVSDKKQKCYFFSQFFEPVASLEQCQLLTNSLVFHSLPDFILKNVSQHTKEDEQVMEQLLLNSQLLDASQSKLPHNLDVHNLPGYRPPRTYGIRHERKVSTFIHHLLMELNQTQSEKDLMHVVEDAQSRITLPHSGKVIHMDYKAKVILCSRKPMLAVANPEEVRSFAGTPLPDIFPLLPFVHSREIELDPVDGFAVSGRFLTPHTVFMSFEKIRLLLTPEQFYGMSLLSAFAHAAAYAREFNKNLTGDLETPVTFNIVHTNGQYFHIGRFQLNTLDCNGNTRNLFWFEPWEATFESAGFDSAKPSVKKVNPRPLSLLRALYK